MEAHVLTEPEMEQYRRDGFFLVRSLFDAEEMALLQQACQIDQAIRDNALKQAGVQLGKRSFYKPASKRGY